MAGPADAGSTTQIVLLGTGTPITDPDRSGPSVAVVVGDTPYLVDLGPGVVRRAARPGLLILYHQLFWGASEAALLQEIQAVYDGRVVSGKDLDVY